MALPQPDVDYLSTKGHRYSVVEEGGMTCVVLQGYNLPAGFNRESTDLLVRLTPGYPDIAPDMWWFEPAVHRADGKPIAAADHTEAHIGRSWQRWSRHLEVGQWMPGNDTLEAYMATLHANLEQASAKEGVN